MNKTELVKAVASQQQISTQRAGEAVEVMLQSVATALEQGERVQIKAFGSFTTRARKAREGRNPSTGEPVQIPSRRAVVFKAAKSLLTTVASGGPPALSPDAAPDAALDDDLGRRRHLRSPVELRVEYFLLDKFIADYTRNISRGGVFIRSEQLLEVGTELAFKLHVPPLEEPLALRGRVAWVRDEVSAADAGKAAGMGVEFIYASEEERLRTVRTVEALLSGADEAPPEPAEPPPEEQSSAEVELGSAGEPRRSHPRVPLVFEIQYESVDQFVTEYTRNISRGGLFIKTVRVLPEGTEFLFNLHVPGFEQPVELRGHVAWVRTAEQVAGSGAVAGMGVRFIYGSEDEQIFKQGIIGDILRRHRTSSARRSSS
jgi:type IV pilus assembly protein PilZ